MEGALLSAMGQSPLERISSRLISGKDSLPTGYGKVPVSYRYGSVSGVYASSSVHLPAAVEPLMLSMIKQVV